MQAIVTIQSVIVHKSDSYGIFGEPGNSAEWDLRFTVAGQSASLRHDGTRDESVIPVNRPFLVELSNIESLHVEVSGVEIDDSSSNDSLPLATLTITPATNWHEGQTFRFSAAGHEDFAYEVVLDIRSAEANVGSSSSPLSTTVIGTIFKISNLWHNLPTGFTGGFDASVNGGGPFAGKCYFFKGDKYIRYDWATDKADAGYPAKISDGWKNMPVGFTGNFDDAVNGQGPFAGKCYFFKGDKYIRYDWATDKADAGYPKKISEGWGNMPSGFTGNFDAIINGNGPFAGKCYFFKGDSYIRYDWKNDCVDSGYPKKIAENWIGLPTGYTSGFNTALEGDKQFSTKGYFFKGDYYIRYNWNEDRAEA